jgi:hypothetical protein
MMDWRISRPRKLSDLTVWNVGELGQALQGK